MAASLTQMLASYDKVNELLKKKDNILIIDSIYRDDNVHIVKYTNGMMEYRVHLSQSFDKFSHSFRTPFLDTKNLYAYCGFVETNRIDIDISPALDKLTATTISLKSRSYGYYGTGITVLVVGYWK